MNSKLSFVIFLIAISLNISYAQDIMCNYRNSGLFSYVCDLAIQNPNGFNNFTEIRGTHLTGRTDDDVAAISRTSASFTTNIPSIICDTFTNTSSMEFFGIGIERIDEDSFRNCVNLRNLDLGGNSIFEINENSFSQNPMLHTLLFAGNRLKTLPANLFTNQGNLSSLGLARNNITDFPTNIFAPLTSLVELNIDFNQLNVIHSHWFGNLPTLSFLQLRANHIDAVDERIIDNTGVYWIGMVDNLCANQVIMDITSQRQQMRNALRVCIQNYGNLGGCTPGNLDERVCRLEDQNKQQQKQIEDLQRAVEELLNRNCTCT